MAVNRLAGRAVRVGTFEPGSPEWHAARASGLGASEIAAVVGLSPWESPWSLWQRKAGNIGQPADTDEMAAGRDFESAIADRFALWHPELRAQRTGTWLSSARRWQLANPDRLVWPRTRGDAPPRVPLEIKYAPYSDGWGPSGTDEIPVYYRCQVLQQMDVLDAPYAWLFAFVGTEYREYRVDWHADDAALLRTAGGAFIASLPQGEDDPGSPPDLDTSAHTYRAVRDLTPGIEDREQEITAELADNYRAAVAAEKAAKETGRLQRSRLLLAMGDARRAVTPDGERVAIRVLVDGHTQLRPSKPQKKAQTSVKDAIAS